MITLHFENLVLFIPQYIFSTVLAIIVYYYLGRVTPKSDFTSPRIRKAAFLGTSLFRTPFSATDTPLAFPPCHQVCDFGESLKSYFNKEQLFFSLVWFFTLNGFPESYYRSTISPYTPPHLFEENITYQMYRIMVAVSAWAGIMLVVTPFSYVYVFLPHFPDPYNIIVAIILAISIFEGIISTIFFRLGVSYTRIALVESLVVIIFTLSLLSPSMSWMSAFNLNGKLLIYLVLLFLFTAITALISQLRTRKNLFLSSLLFATIAYFSFSAIVLVNVLQIAFS